MAINWKYAQFNEKKFWEDLYVKNVKDDVYNKTSDEGWKNFALHIFKLNNLDINFLNGKTVVDLGSGPGGVARGIQVLIEKNEIKNCSIVAIDPIMDFYKKEIGILKENHYTKLLTNKGEQINLPDNSVDIIFSTNVLDHCENPLSLISEAYRILKPKGTFFPSVHLVYDYLKILSPFIKYFDTNHPHHFTKSTLLKKLKYNFNYVKTINTFTINYDQRNFTFKYIFKSKNFLRSFKRFLSNYVLYTCYFKCKKN